ncbi:anti-repressor SinI family protein [Virgibacillus doumboii]|uniref:anti-repressor SinI family protein n=1 Tax=Virgibacillus doumboii TaxID=2697503 RepID=UPI0013E018BD|nr:anti-repressor SinI family protein [Virgibacillus doumboii]
MGEEVITGLDREWVELISEAKRQGITKDDLHDLFSGSGKKCVMEDNLIVSIKNRPAWQSSRK